MPRFSHPKPSLESQSIKGLSARWEGEGLRPSSSDQRPESIRRPALGQLPVQSPFAGGIHHLRALERDAVEAPVPREEGVGMAKGMGAKEEVRSDPARLLGGSGPEAGPAGSGLVKAGSFPRAGAWRVEPVVTSQGFS
jgi:hypothetical protein